eukprot:285388_1
MTRSTATATPETAPPNTMKQVMKETEPPATKKRQKKPVATESSEDSFEPNVMPVEHTTTTDGTSFYDGYIVIAKPNARSAHFLLFSKGKYLLVTYCSPDLKSWDGSIKRYIGKYVRITAKKSMNEDFAASCIYATEERLFSTELVEFKAPATETAPTKFILNLLPGFVYNYGVITSPVSVFHSPTFSRVECMICVQLADQKTTTKKLRLRTNTPIEADTLQNFVSSLGNRPHLFAGLKPTEFNSMQQLEPTSWSFVAAPSRRLQKVQAFKNHIFMVKNAHLAKTD